MTVAADADIEGTPEAPRFFAWVVFALTFGLMLSDYMSRQALNAVFPALKAEWNLSDTQLGSLNSIVALFVGGLTFPLSVLADRWGRARSIVWMAAVWSVATAACAGADTYRQLFVARCFVGVGEAAYGSVGIALILSVFPPQWRSSVSGAFLAGGPLGSVLGMALGGMFAARFGWRWAFTAMALFGLALATVYAVVVSERRMAAARPEPTGPDAARSGGRSGRALLSELFPSVAICCAYVGSGLQLFTMASLIAWLPSYVNRVYELPGDQAALVAAVFALLGALGMAGCGVVTDRLCRTNATRRWTFALAFSALSSVLILLAFRLPTGTAQLVSLGAGMLLVAGTTGPASAMVADLTNPAVHAAAFATLALANNLLGLTPGPFITGVLADRVGLLGALRTIPVVALAAALAFAVGRRISARGLSVPTDRSSSGLKKIQQRARRARRRCEPRRPRS